MRSFHLGIGYDEVGKEGHMNDKGVSENLKVKKKFKAFYPLQYWIAAIAYLVVFSLSILCLVAYLPDLSGADILGSGTINFLKALIVVILVCATAVFIWETLQWRERWGKKNQQPSLEDIVKGIKRDSK